MKKIFLSFCVLVLICSGYIVAEDMVSIVDTDISSFTVVGNDASVQKLLIASTTPKILIKKINITNNDTSVAQFITLYDGFSLNTSTTNVDEIWRVKIDSGTGTDNLEVDFGDRWYLRADYGLAIRKSATTSTIGVSVQYK